MKNKKYITLTLLFLFCIISLVICKETTCNLDDCNGKRIKNGRYCIEHTCEVDGCVAQKGVAKTVCYYHFEEHINNYQTENEFTLTDSQTREVRKIVDEYCNKLVSEHSNILSVNIINDTPNVVSKSSLTYDCNVVLKGDNTNLGTIYVLISSDGTFKVNNLLYE